MKEYPILFSAPMVRAILEGRKTQTRRVVKGTALDWLQPDMFTPQYVASPENFLSPYGFAGDRLWVKETAKLRGVDRRRNGYIDGFDLHYRADDAIIDYPGRDDHKPYKFTRFTPSIFMPRWASRIALDVSNVHIERLQDISETDAEAEGINLIDHNCFENYLVNKDYYFRNVNQKGKHMLEDPIGSYATLWEKINGAGSWNINPWVWVVEFPRTASNKACTGQMAGPQ